VPGSIDFYNRPVSPKLKVLECSFMIGYA